MLVPIIKIKEKFGNKEYTHIVGTNSHDELIIEGNAIHYINLQGMVGTQYPEESGMYFEGIEPDEDSLIPWICVEMVTVEELIKIAEKNMKKQTEASIKMHKAFKEYLEEKGKCQKRWKKIRRKTTLQIHQGDYSN